MCSLETAVSPTCSTTLLGNLRVPFISPPTDGCNRLPSILSSVVSSCPAPHLAFVLFYLYEVFGNTECFPSAFNNGMGSCIAHNFDILINLCGTLGVRNNRQEAMIPKTTRCESMLLRCPTTRWFSNIADTHIADTERRRTRSVSRSGLRLHRGLGLCWTRVNELQPAARPL